MSKINLEAPFTAFRGKICKHSKIIFAQRGDTQYTSQICNGGKQCERGFGGRYAEGCV